MNNDMVNHPAHYEGKYECKDVMLECFGKQAVMDFYKLCAFKYLYRCMKKHETPNLDIEKAHWYLGEWIKLADDEMVAEPVEPEELVEDDFDQGEYTLVDDNHSIRVPNNINGIIEGLRFKGKHIKAKTEPAFFDAAAATMQWMAMELYKRDFD